MVFENILAITDFVAPAPEGRNVYSYDGLSGDQLLDVVDVRNLFSLEI
jgi:hypothetical protein